MLDQTVIWQFLHSSDTYESADYTVSLHLTKRGAYFAMRKHRQESFTASRNQALLFGKEGNGEDYEFGQRWSISEIGVEE
jgi:hypothetical protein